MTPFEWIGAVMLLVGSFFCVVGGIGLHRMPDFYTRAHAASVTDTMGAFMVLGGLMLFGGLTLVTVKLGMIAAFMFVTGPTAGHALCKAAYVTGTVPVLAEDRTLVVADLHFEKGSAFAARGDAWLPPYDTGETLARLERVCRQYQPRRCCT